MNGCKGMVNGMTGSSAVLTGEVLPVSLAIGSAPSLTRIRDPSPTPNGVTWEVVHRERQLG